jgi:hypothetical protein
VFHVQPDLAKREPDDRGARVLCVLKQLVDRVRIAGIQVAEQTFDTLFEAIPAIGIDPATAAVANLINDRVQRPSKGCQFNRRRLGNATGAVSVAPARALGLAAHGALPSPSTRDGQTGSLLRYPNPTRRAAAIWGPARRSSPPY